MQVQYASSIQVLIIQVKFDDLANYDKFMKYKTHSSTRLQIGVMCF
jgi:hypothetical protein